MTNLAIFASGSGSNAENLYNYFENDNNISIRIILTNNPNAGVIERAKRLNIELLIFTREQFYNSDLIIQILKDRQTDLIVLAGFLWLVPKNIIGSFHSKIINIHPALLPNYGGKGMYGDRVHRAVINAGETESGITIHYVNEVYDQGQIIFQAKCKISDNETPESLAKKIHNLEYEYFPQIVKKVVLNLI